MVRKIVLDLERGDFCKIELESYKRDINSLRTSITIKEEQIATKNTHITKLEGIIEEKVKQIKLKEDEISTLKKEKAGKYWNGLFTGLGTGAGVILILTLL